MANIDELHWSAILDTKDFDAKAEYLRKEAKRLNVELSKMLDIYQKFKGKTLITEKGVENAKQMSEVLSEIKKKMDSLPASVKVYERGTENVNRSLDGTNARYREQSKLLRQLTTLAGTYFSVRGVQSFLKSLIDITGQFEVQKMALTSMLQSSQVADRIFNEYRQLALNSPYTFQDFTKFGKQLTAFNIPANQLVDTTKMLADVAAGLGVDMGRIILAYGQIKSAGVLKGTELRQLTEAGVPILESLAKQIEETTGKTVKLAEVFQMISKKQIPFEMVEKAFRDMTSEGGKFYNMQEVLVETLQGKIGKLRDAWQQALYDMGSESTINKVLKGSIDLLTQMVMHLEDIAKAVVPIIAGFGAYGVALAAVAVGQKALELANFISMLYKVATGSKAAASALAFMGNTAKMVALSVGAFAALAVAIVEIVRVANRGRRAMEDFNKTLKDIHETSMENNSYDKEIDDIKRLRKILNDSNSSYDARLQALQSLKSIVPDYHADLTAEGLLIDNNKESLDAYIKSLEREAKIMGLKDELEALRKQKKEVEDDIDEINKKIGASSHGGSIAPGSIVQPGETALSQALLPGDLDTKEKQLAAVSDRIKEIEGDIESLTKETFDADKVVTTTLSTTVDTIADTRKKIADLRKKAANDGLTDGEVKLLKSLTAELAEAEKEYNLLTGHGYGEKNKKEDKERQNRISDIKAEISVLEDYKKAYDRLEPIYGEDTENIISGVFGSDIDYQATLSKIKELIEELRSLGAAGSEAATAIETRLGMDAVSRMEKAGQALKKADEELAKSTDKIAEYLGKDFSRQGEGVAESISKLLSDLVNKNLKVDLDTDELIADLEKATKDHFIAANADLFAEMGASTDEQKALANAFWDEYKKRRVAEIKDQAKQQKDANEADTREKVLSRVKSIFSEQMVGYDLTNWNDKTLGQILAIRDAINGLDIPDSMREELSQVDGLLEAAIAAFKQYKEEVLTNTVNPEMEKKVVSTVEKVSTYLSRAASSMKELAIASGNTELEDLATATGMVSQNLNAAAAGYQMTGSWIGAVVGGGLDLIEQTITAISNVKSEAREVRDAIRDIQRESAKVKAEGVFGSSVFGDGYNAEAVVDKLKELEKSIQKTNSAYLFRTKKGGLFNAEETKSIARFAAEAKMDLWDEYGNLNAELIAHILSTYKDTLTEEQSNWLKDAQSYSEQYAAIMDGVKERVEDIFGEIADSAADNIVNQWIEAGDAALDYADILDEVARSYAKMLIKTAILDDVLNMEEADKIIEMFKTGDYESAMAAIASDMQKISDMQPIYENILGSFDPYFKEAQGNDTLANGIKGITEDTAGLLASYINAMRADVSYMRMLQENGWKDVSGIYEAMGAFPTLNDHLAKVAADAHDMALSNRQILTELQSVITSASGRRSIAVDVQ